MNFNDKQLRNLLWTIPAIIALLIALIPTLKLQWPLTIDIFFHIHIAQVYSQYGITLTDPLIDPGIGYKIAYPPLFPLFLAFLVKLFNIDYIQAAKLVQPILAFSLVLSVSYVAKKFYGNIAGISAGFLMISSYLFSRMVSPLPETMALIFLPLAVYFYYKSVKDKNYSFALISGFMFILIVVTHQAAILCSFLIITAIMIVLTLFSRNIRYFTNYLVFLLIPVAAAGLVLLGLSLMMPGFMQNLLTNGLSATGFMTSIQVTEPVSYLKYIAYMGIAFPFAIIGGAIAIWKRREQDLIIIVWIVTVFLISKSYWFGINVVSIRLLIYLLIPVSILAGFGLKYLYAEFKVKEVPSFKIRSAFLVLILLLSSIFAVATVADSNFGVIPRFAEVTKDGLNSPQIAPPTSSDIDLVKWFKNNGNKNYIALSNNYFATQFVLANTGQPIASFYRLSLWMSSGYNDSIINNASEGYYFIFDKRFTYNAPSGNVKGGEYSYFFNNETYNPKNLIHGNKKIVYENNDYIIFEKKF